ncbi:MAG: hypothetical protein LBS72_00875 [Oscillospiraceae bacterium]|nr:hypothetical protein [Oscillospiraceae bacterium]
MAVNFIFNIAFVGAVIYFLIIGLFTIGENYAHLNIESASINEITNISAASISGDITNGRIIINLKDTVDDPFNYVCEEIITDGVSYNYNEYALIVPSKVGEKYTRIEIAGRTDTIISINPVLYEIYGKNSESNIRTMRGGRDIIISADHSLRVETRDELTITLDNEAILRNKIDTSDEIICREFIIKGGNIYIDIACPNDAALRSVAADAAYSANLTIYKASDFSANMTGTLNFYYSAKSSVYSLLNQDIVIGCKSDDMSATIKHINDSLIISVNGIATLAEISSLDLFPTFTGWYRENIYMIPLTLISTIWAGVALIKERTGGSGAKG